MLTGPELGAAIEAARIKKAVTKAEMARHFKVTQPSIQDWVRRGTVDRSKLVALFEYFAPVVGPEHWGLQPEAGHLLAIAASHSPADQLAQALRVIGAALMKCDGETREAVATNLAAWARSGSNQSYQAAVLGLLSQQTRRRAA